MDSLSLPLFPPTHKSDWQAQVQRELKNELTADNLRWATDEGFALDPYYTTDDLPQLPLETIQAAQKQTPGWLNAPDCSLTDDPKADNNRLRDALDHGADALVVRLPAGPGPTGQVAGPEFLTRLLNGIKLSDTPVFFQQAIPAAGFDRVDFVQSLQSVAPYQLKGGLLMDVHPATAEVTRLTRDSPLFRTICINSHPFHNAGATATQELAFTLASLADAYDQLTDDDFSIDQLVSKTVLSLSVGTSYFLEIAKLRALRVLLNRFLTAYSPSASADRFFIHTQTSAFYDSTATPYTNLLRATTEAMAAVIGGCDALTVHPFDTALGQSANAANRDHAARIARNVSILLTQESYLDKVADASAGSYYIETLTHQLLEAAWSLFLVLEKRGGYQQAFADGFVQSEVERSYRQKIDAVKAGNVLVGVTKFRSDEGAPLAGQVSEDGPGSLPNRRLAGAFE